MRRTTIIIEDDGDDGMQTYPSAIPFPSTRRDDATDNGWVGGINICATCPNRPGGPNNRSGACHCAIPSMYGPWRITC